MHNGQDCCDGHIQSVIEEKQADSDSDFNSEGDDEIM